MPAPIGRQAPLFWRRPVFPPMGPVRGGSGSAIGSGSGCDGAAESPVAPGSLATSVASSSIVDGGRRRRPPGTPEPVDSSLAISSPVRRTARAAHCHTAALAPAQFGCSGGSDQGNERIFFRLRRDPDLAGSRSRSRQRLGGLGGDAKLDRPQRRGNNAGALGTLHEDLAA